MYQPALISQPARRLWRVDNYHQIHKRDKRTDKRSGLPRHVGTQGVDHQNSCGDGQGYAGEESTAVPGAGVLADEDWAEGRRHTHGDALEDPGI